MKWNTARLLYYQFLLLVWKKKRKRGTCLGKEGLLRTPTIRIPYIFAICCVNTINSLRLIDFMPLPTWGCQ